MKWHFYDWDDTLALTRKALYLSYKEALKDFDIQFDFNYFNDFIYDDSNKFLQGLNFSIDEIAEIKKVKEHHYINTYFDEIIFKLPDFKNNRIDHQYYIVTNTNEELVTTMLNKKFSNTVPWQDIVGTYSGIKRKPEPDVYVTAFEKIKHQFHSSTDELHIYEDSIAGLLAASKFIHMYEKRIKNFEIHHVKHENPFINNL
ncbi:MAG: HAD hydrolase-like protein [Candidatus Pacearchaeota archaeon]|jgi:beta-phosphoglucomutase-like phosphatase (HAD superfamily)|nr:HAD family hydrolase [Clostridia bacterium]